MAIRIIVDSTADLTPQVRERVAVVPLTPVSSSAAAGTVSSSAIVRAHKAVSQCFISMVCLS